MRKIVLFISTILIYPHTTLADKPIEKLRTTRFSVFVLNNVTQDATTKFVYTSNFDSYFNQLNSTLKKRDAIKDAKQALANGTVFLISNFNKQPNQPDLTKVDSYYHQTIYTVCPQKTLQADNPYSYIDKYKLDYIRLHPSTQQKKEPVFKYDSRTQQYLLPDSYKPYNLSAYLYAKAWNEIMLPHCIKRAAIPDENEQPPVKAKHRLVSKKAFILEDSTLLRPGKGYGTLSSIEEKIYKQRLLKALQLSNPEDHALAALAHNETYFLGTRKHSLGLSRKPPPVVHYRRFYRGKPAAPRLLPDFAPNTNSGEHEFELLRTVCSSYEIEGQDFYDEKIIAASRRYAEQWNQQMLTACRVKLEKTIKTHKAENHLKLVKAWDTWLRNYPSTYSFQLRDESKNPTQATLVSVKNDTVLKATDLNTKHLLPKGSFLLKFEDLFSRIEIALLYERTASLEVAYSTQYGYPTRLRVEPMNGSDQSRVDYFISDVRLNRD